MLRRLALPAALLLCAACLAATAPLALAQYMYLDSNGDGVNTDADLLAATGTTTVEIWLITDRNRDGAPATCAVDSSATMTINSYEVILQSVGGTVSWSNFTNLMPSATTPFGYRSDGTELYAGYGGGEILPPGTYRVARFDVSPVMGTPSLIFGRSSRVYPPGYTSFGSACLGIDQDNTLKFGSDWHDTDGLLGPMVSHAPIVDPVPDQVMFEGQTRGIALGATDNDGSWMTLTVSPLPRFARFSETSNEPGRVQGGVSLSPGYADSGNYVMVVRADDGEHVGEEEFQLKVVDRQPPPPPSERPDISVLTDLGVQPGSVRNVSVSARDFDSDSVSLHLADAPGFASLLITLSERGHVEGVLQLTPLGSDVGTWPLSLTATDGVSTVSRDVTVTVGPNHPPALSRPDTLVVLEGGHGVVALTATDADWDSIWTEVSWAPAFVTAGGVREFGYEYRSLDATPAIGDVGEYRIDVAALDGFSRTEQPVALSVFAVGELPVSWTPASSGTCVEPLSIRYFGVTARDSTGSPLSLAVLRTPSWIVSETTGPGAVMLTIKPLPTDPPGAGYVVLRASNATGAFGTRLLTFSLRPYGECYPSCGICAGGPGGGGDVSAPTAVAGGPYHGYVGEPIRLDGRWSSLGSYSWKFGDGASAYGALVEHRYGASGQYQAILTASSGNFVSRDTADVSVSEPIPARVFVWPATRVIPLTDSRATIELRVEPLGVGYGAASLRADASCLRAEGMGETDSIGAAPGKPPSVGDVDGNGTPDVCVPFAVSDLRRLFASVRTKREVSARFETRAADGAPVRGAVALAVLGTPSTGIQIGPNPFNPSGTIAFEVETAGPVRVRQFDVTGRLVRTFLDEAAGRPGPRVVTIDGRDGLGRSLASGVYFFKIERGARVDRARVIILK